MVLTSDGITQTPRAPRYLSQMCKHMGALGIQVHATDDTYGLAEFGLGSCELRAEPEHLVLTLKTRNPWVLKRVQDVLTADIERFGRRERLTVHWSPPVKRPGRRSPTKWFRDAAVICRLIWRRFSGRKEQGRQGSEGVTTQG
jgi:uncharacterized protein